VAQGFTVPLGLEAREGNGCSIWANPFAAPQGRFQYSDAALRGPARPGLQRLELRRDATQVGTFPARTARVGLLLAECDAAALTTAFAANYAGNASLVFSPKPVAIPDLSALPVGAPAAWSIAIPFDVPWSYSGTLDLIWEVQLDSNSQPGMPLALDSVEASAPGQGAFAYLGMQPCTSPNGPFNIYAQPPATSSAGVVRLACTALRGPSSAIGVLALGLSDPNLTGIFCAPMRTSADVLLPVLGDATGAFGTVQQPIGLVFPFSGPVSVYAQFAALDPTEPIVGLDLSDAVRLQVLGWVPPFQTSRLSSTLSPNAPLGVRSDYHVLVARMM
jgi:hypothetical protein